MKRTRIVLLLALICLTCATASVFASCVKEPTKFNVKFVVDGAEYATVETAGNEIINLPPSPTKEGGTFLGWYCDEGSWFRPFTEDYLLNVALSSDIVITARFSDPPHQHELVFVEENDATCYLDGNEAYYVCVTCGKYFSDGQG